MRFILRSVLAASVLMLASFAGCVLSAQTADERVVLRAVYAEFYPYMFRNESGEATGYSIDVLQQIAERGGYALDFVEAENPKQFLTMLERGEIDVSPLMALTPERRASHLATTPLGEYKLSVYVRHDHDLRAVAQISGHRIGVVTGSISYAAAKLLNTSEIVEYRTSDALLLPLLSGEIDAVVGVSELFEASLRTHLIKDRMRVLDTPLAIIPYGYLVRRDLPEVLAALDRAIATNTTPQSLAQLRSGWFGRDRSVVEQPWFWNVALIFLGITMTTVALGYYSLRLQGRSRRLLRENSDNQLLVDALDQMRAAIVIFDHDMKPVHWNSGFAGRFAQIVPELERAASLEKVCAHFTSSAPDPELGTIPSRCLASHTVELLEAGQSEQRIVQTAQGDTFDLSVFPLGERYFAAIWVDVTELHDQQQHIARQGRELMQKNSQLLAFSAMAAHDLKAPLMQQRTLVEFIEEDMADAKIDLPAETVSHFATLSDLSGRMSLLVSDLLEFAKADKNFQPAECFSPNVRLEGILKMSALDHRMTFEIMPDMPAVRVAPVAFDMVMRNLISNAVKHHDRQRGKIILRAYARGDWIIVEVEDDGPGISPAQQGRVFEPFARLTNVDGTGLGLALVQKTVTAWGGRVKLRSAANHGCVFSISVPVGHLDPLDVPVAAPHAGACHLKAG